MVMSERHFRYDVVLLNVRRYECEIQCPLPQVSVVQRVLVSHTSLKNKTAIMSVFVRCELVDKPPILFEIKASWPTAFIKIINLVHSLRQRFS